MNTGSLRAKGGKRKWGTGTRSGILRGEDKWGAVGGLGTECLVQAGSLGKKDTDIYLSLIHI